jgi:hypothetical protein
MANQYSDLFTYETLAFDGANVSYANVTLLKDMSAKKAGAKLDEIRLDTRTGKFTVPRPKAGALSTRSKTEMETAAKTLVEFQGKHTRFEEEETDGIVWLGNEGFEMPTRTEKTDDTSTEVDYTIPLPSDPKSWREKMEKGESSSSQKKTYTVKIYENKRKLLRPDSSIKKYFLKSIEVATEGLITSESTGTRGEILVTIETSKTIVGSVTPFTVWTARNRNRECYYSVIA